MFSSISKYYDNKSDVHKINPVYKIISLIIYFLLFLITDNLMFSILMLLFSLLLILLSKVPLKLYFFRSIPILLLCAILFIFILALGGDITLIIKLISFSLYYSVYIYTTKLIETNKAIYKILTFLDIYNSRFSSILLILIHFIQFAFIESISTYRTIKARNIQGNIYIKIFYYSYLKLKEKIYRILYLYKTKKYNYNYRDNNNVVSDLILLVSHIMLFFVYFFGKI